MAQKWNKPKTKLSETFLSSNKSQVCSGTRCGQIGPAGSQVDWFDKSHKSGLLPQGIRDNLRNGGSEAGVQVVCIQLSLKRHQLQTWSTWCHGVTDINIPGGDRQETQGCREKQETLGQEVARPGGMFTLSEEQSAPCDDVFAPVDVWVCHVMSLLFTFLVL